MAAQPALPAVSSAVGQAWASPVFIALLSLLVAGCADSDSGARSGADGADTSFGVIETIPAPGARDVAMDTTIEVVFSQDVNFDTVGAGSFEVVGTSSGKLTGFFVHGASHRKLHLSVPGGFAYGEQVSVQLSEAIRSSLDVALPPFSFQFAVEPAPSPNSDPDPQPEPAQLKVLGMSPEAGETNVSPDRPISILWSEAVPIELLTEETLWLSSATTGRIAASVEVSSPDGSAVTILHEAPFRQGDRITVHLSSEVRASSGAPFRGGAFTFKVRTAPPAAARTVQKVYTTLGNVRSLRVGDFNADQVTDVAYCVEGEKLVDVLLADREGDLELAVRIEVGREVLSLALADADSDGDLDVLAGTVDRVMSYLNQRVEDGEAAPTLRFAVGPESPTGAAVRSLAAGDLDHCGLPDIVLDTDRGVEVRLGGITAQPQETLGASRQSRTDVVVADVNLDGWLDIAFGEAGRPGILLCIARPSGTAGSAASWFSRVLQIETGTASRQLAVDDLGGDGLPDILVLAADAPLGTPPLQVLRQVAEGFELEVEPAARMSAAEALAGEPGSQDGMVVADLEGDGFDDVVLASSGENRVLCLPNVVGRLAPLADAQALFEAPRPRFVETADITGQGGVELIAAGGREIHILLQAVLDPPPPDGDTFEMSIDDVRVRQKDTGATLGVRITNAKPVQGYTVALGFDPAAIAPKGVSLEGSQTGSLAPEFADYRVLESGNALVYNVLIDVLPPFEEKAVPAGTNQLLFRVEFDVPDAAPTGRSPITFVEDSGPPSIETMLVVDASSVYPVTRAGEVEILPLEPDPLPIGSDRMKLGSATVRAGQTGAISLVADSTIDMDAFTVAVTFDKNILEVTDFPLAGTVTESKAPEMVVPLLENEEGYAIFTVILDFLPPFARQQIPAGNGLHLCDVELRVAAGAPTGEYPVLLENGLGPNQLANIVVHDGQSFYPTLSGGKIQVEGSTPSGEFLRADADGNGRVNLSDSVFVLDYLFRGGTAPECPDAADADDTGNVSITDAIYILDHLFRGGPAPPAPYPDKGTDPTSDSLLCP